MPANRLRFRAVSQWLPSKLVVGCVLLLVTTCPAWADPPTSGDRGVGPVPTEPTPQPIAAYHRKYALLIGIDKYKNFTEENQLHHAVDDVNALGPLLKDHYGFDEIKTLINEQATKDAIPKAYNELLYGQNVTEDDCLLVYFAGHGGAVKFNKGGAAGFIVPYDAGADCQQNPPEPKPYKDTCLDMEDILKDLQEGTPRHVLLMADVCYSGFFAKPRALPENSVGEDLTPTNVRGFLKGNAVQIFTAGTSDQPVQEKGGDIGHGIFSYWVLQELQMKAAMGAVFTAKRLGMDVGNTVMDKTEDSQRPVFSDSEKSGGEFLFFPVGGTIVPEGPHIEILDMPANHIFKQTKVDLHIQVKDATDMAPWTLLINKKLVNLPKPTAGPVKGVWDLVQTVVLHPGDDNSVVLSVVDVDGISQIYSAQVICHPAAAPAP